MVEEVSVSPTTLTALSRFPERGCNAQAFLLHQSPSPSNETQGISSRDGASPRERYSIRDATTATSATSCHLRDILTEKTMPKHYFLQDLTRNCQNNYHVISQLCNRTYLHAPLQRPVLQGSYCGIGCITAGAESWSGRATLWGCAARSTATIDGSFHK